MKKTLELQLQKYIHPLLDRLSSIIPEEKMPLSSLFDAARYSLLSDGKRIRAIIPLCITDSALCVIEPFLDVACAIELIHTYSLIHDDLPCMDDDDFRRGKPSLHKAYSESTAVLTGDFLLTYAFEILAKQYHLSSEQRLELISSLSSCSGGLGLIGGQILDLYYEEKKLSISTLEMIYEKKTANLFICAFAFGGILIKATTEVMHHLKLIGKHLGILYQYMDDLHDATSDAKRKKLNYTDRFSKKLLDEKVEFHFNTLEASLHMLPFTIPLIDAFIDQLKAEVTLCKI
ncbi:MAG: polyprenyl synthetase family protein [Chlamydiales bacterium]|nr:polyprenyl synthetase family protein [Chlamydiales bacterium]